jgi:hypothetical protein
MSASADPPGRASPRPRWRSVWLLLAAGAALCGAGVLAIGLGGGGLLAEFDLDELVSRLRGMGTHAPADTTAREGATSRAPAVSDAERAVAAAKSGTTGKGGPAPSDPGRLPSAHPGASQRGPSEPKATAAARPRGRSAPATEAEPTSSASAAAPEGRALSSARKQPGEREASLAPPGAQEPDEREAIVALPHDRSVVVREEPHGRGAHLPWRSPARNKRRRARRSRTSERRASAPCSTIGATRWPRMRATPRRSRRTRPRRSRRRR